jgi:biopolymer transport protein ExbD
VAFKMSPSDSEGDGGIVAEINITPLTDIFLVLLIIFMVTSSVMSQVGVDVNLPAASNATSQSQPEGIIVTLMTGGKMKINEQDVPNNDMAAFETGLRSAFSKTKSRLVILEGDRQAFLGNAIQVMDSARKAGAEKFAIATSPDTGK